MSDEIIFHFKNDTQEDSGYFSNFLFQSNELEDFSPFGELNLAQDHTKAFGDEFDEMNLFPWEKNNDYLLESLSEKTFSLKWNKSEAGDKAEDPLMKLIKNIPEEYQMKQSCVTSSTINGKIKSDTTSKPKKKDETEVIKNFTGRRRFGKKHDRGKQNGILSYKN